MSKPVGRFSQLPIALRVVGSLLAFVLLGTALLMLPAASGNGQGLDFRHASFTAVSALSVTGLSTIVPAQDLSSFGQVILMLLVQLGGVGYMVLAVTIFQLLGRSLALTDRLALQDSLGLLNLGGIAQLARNVLIGVLTIEAALAGLLFLHWRTFLPPEDVGFMAIFHSVSAFCNAGFSLFDGDPRFPAGMPTDGVTLGILGFGILLGGLGVPVLYEILTFRTRRKLSVHTRLTLWTVFGLLAWGAVGLWLSETRAGGSLAGMTLGRQVEYSLFQSISTRTAGYAGFPGFAEINPSTQLMMITLMFIGCAPASMGGGITTGTFVVMVLALIAYLRGQSTPIVAGRAIPGLMVRKAAAVTTVSLFVVTTATWLILLTHDAPMNEVLFEVVSAFATCGLSLGLTTRLNDFGLAVIMLIMLWGRLGALTLLVVLTRQNRQSRIRYPEEKILLG